MQADGPPDGATVEESVGVGVADGVGGLDGEFVGVAAVTLQRFAGRGNVPFAATLPRFVAEKTVLFVTFVEQRNGPIVCSAENMPYGRYVEVPAKGEQSERRRVRAQRLRAGAEPSRLLPFVTCPQVRSRSRL